MGTHSLIFWVADKRVDAFQATHHLGWSRETVEVVLRNILEKSRAKNAVAARAPAGLRGSQVAPLASMSSGSAPSVLSGAPAPTAPGFYIAAAPGAPAGLRLAPIPGASSVQQLVTPAPAPVGFSGSQVSPLVSVSSRSAPSVLNGASVPVASAPAGLQLASVPGAPSVPPVSTIATSQLEGLSVCFFLFLSFSLTRRGLTERERGDTMGRRATIRPATTFSSTRGCGWF